MAVALALILALTACRAPVPAPTATATTDPPPPAFPTVSGSVLDRSMPVAGDWLIRVRVADPEDAYAAAREALVDGGFTLTKDRSGAGGGDGQACTTQLCVSFTATDDPAAGPSVLYEVFHPTGVVD